MSKTLTQRQIDFIKKQERNMSGAFTSREVEAETKTRPAVSHYLQGGIEPIDFIMSHNLSFTLGNIIKYATRCNHKGTKEADLNKVIHYAQFELSRMSKETQNG